MVSSTLLIYYIGEGVISLVSIVVNVVVLIAIFKHHHLHTPTNVFIGHLATADLLLGILVSPITIISSLNLNIDFYLCILLNSVIMMFINVQHVMLLCITGERFVAIRFPFQYQRIIDVRCANCIAMAAWAAGILIGFIPILGWNSGVENYGGKCNFLAVISYSYLVYIGFVCMFLVPITSMTFAYAYIWYVVRRLNRTSFDLYSRFNVTMQRSVRTTKSFVVLIVVFFVLKLPISLFYLMGFYDEIPWSSFSQYKLLIINILLMLDRSDSMVNPFIYAAGTTKMKAAMFNIVLCRPTINTSYRSSQMSSKSTPVNAMGMSSRGTYMSSRISSIATPPNPTERPTAEDQISRKV